MRGSIASRVGLAGVVGVAAVGATVGLLAVSSPNVVAGSADLTPDLVSLAIQRDDVLLEPEQDGRLMLRFTTEVGNRGNGPLEIFPSATLANCDADADADNDRDASQRVFADSNGTGVFERGPDAVSSERRFGCMRYHAAHDHWHVLNFASYELRSEPQGKLVATVRKVGFCLTDARLAFPSPYVGPLATYPINSPGLVGCGVTTTQGISPGWADAYTFAIPGQAVDVSGLSRGRYCLVTHIDPLDVLDESDELNNVRRTRIALRPGRLQVRKLASACRA